MYTVGDTFMTMSHTPKYVQVKEEIRRRIRSKESSPPASPIRNVTPKPTAAAGSNPTQSELCRKFRLRSASANLHHSSNRPSSFIRKKLVFISLLL